MRSIPKTMSTQHPDNASAPYWHQDRFIDAKHEVEECFRSYSELGCTEYMWDWEGKHVDEAVFERMFESYHSFFSKNQLGKDVFLTFRVPNIWQEPGYRIARAFVGIFTANDLAKDIGVHSPPIFEAILPMTTDSRKLFYIRKKYAELARAFKVLKPVGPSDLEVIPLIEQAERMAFTKNLLADYVRLGKQDSLLKSKRLSYIRPFLARSDPALNSGMVGAVLGVKLGLNSCFEFEDETGIDVYPILGCGSLPFRGSLTPESVGDFCAEYKGITTVTVQSAFKYDYPLAGVKRGIKELNRKLGGRAVEISPRDSRVLRRLVGAFGKSYRTTVEAIAGDISRISAFVPRRRERRLHIGLFGYSRKVGKKSLPRAIAFVCAAYSLGVPPEFIGVGRTIKTLNSGERALLEENYVNLRKDLVNAGYYLNRENLDALAENNSGWRAVREDVRLAEEYLGSELGPEKNEHLIHRNLTSNIRLLQSSGRNAGEEIVRAGEIRKSLG